MEQQPDAELSSLLAGVRAGEESAFAALCERYAPLMNAVADEFSRPFVQDSELLAEAMGALHRAAMAYTPGRCVTFGLFARICMCREVRRYVQKAEQHAATDLDVESVAVPCNVESRIMASEARRELLRHVRQIVSAYEYEVLLLHMQGYTTDEIASALHRERRSVDNAKARVFKRLRENRDLFAD